MTPKEIITSLVQGIQSVAVIVLWGIGKITMEQALLFLGVIATPNVANMVVARHQAEQPMKAVEVTHTETIALAHDGKKEEETKP